MKMIANVLAASALVVGFSSFAADRMNATEGNKSQADKTMQNHTSDMPAKSATSSGMAGDTARKNATVGNKSQADKTMQNHSSDMPMKNGATNNGMAGDTARKNATEGNKSEAK